MKIHAKISARIKIHAKFYAKIKIIPDSYTPFPESRTPWVDFFFGKDPNVRLQVDAIGADFS